MQTELLCARIDSDLGGKAAGSDGLTLQQSSCGASTNFHFAESTVPPIRRDLKLRGTGDGAAKFAGPSRYLASAPVTS